jgi:hypothetical protein
LKVTFDLSDDSRLTEWQSHRHSQSVELFVFSFFSQAAISAFAENPASFLGLVAPNPVAAGRFEEELIFGIWHARENSCCYFFSILASIF